MDPRWATFHNYQQLSDPGRHFIEAYNLLDEVVRGNAFMNLDALKDLMAHQSALSDHDAFLIELFCSNYNPREWSADWSSQVTTLIFFIDELPDDLNDIINAISAVTLDPSSMNVNLETVEQRKQEVMQFIRNIHRSRSNVDGDVSEYRGTWIMMNWISFQMQVQISPKTTLS